MNAGRPARSGNYTTDQQNATRLLYDRLAVSIEKRRARLGLTRAALAKLAGETEHAVEKAERGGGLPVRALFAVADALGCSVNELRGDQ